MKRSTQFSWAKVERGKKRRRPSIFQERRLVNGRNKNNFDILFFWILTKNWWDQRKNDPATNFTKKWHVSSKLETPFNAEAIIKNFKKNTLTLPKSSKDSKKPSTRPSTGRVFRALEDLANQLPSISQIIKTSIYN